MAKELPYFRLTCQEWQNGDIVDETLSTQGLFMQICCYYWMKNCSVSLEKVQKKFKKKRKMIQKLTENKILKISDGFIKINFLDEQWSELQEFRQKKRIAGSKGGKQKASNAKAELKHNSSYKEKDKDKDNTIPAKSRKPDPYWDQVCELWSFDPQTKPERTRIGKVVRDFKLKTDNPNEIKKRKSAYAHRWSQIDCSPEALLKHWDQFKVAKQTPKKSYKPPEFKPEDRPDKDFIENFKKNQLQKLNNEKGES